MKSINYFFVCLFTLTFVACSSAESDNHEDNTSNFESIKSLYGIESVSYDHQVNDIPSVSTEGIVGVLEALRKNSAIPQGCRMEEEDYGSQSNKKRVVMTAEYQARTRNGTLLECFVLCVSLNFHVEKGELYYVGTSYNYETGLFLWRGYGASLTAAAEGGSVFNSTSYLYFRVNDQGDCLVKVPVVFKGSYDFAANKGVYSFILSKTYNN